MRISRVRANNRKRTFEVETRRGLLLFPYSEADPRPSSDDPICDLFVDADLGREAFTFVLDSGSEGTIHIDSVLEYNEDPTYLADLLLYRLTTEAKQRFDASPLSAREVARRLETSPTQLYRLLDPTNYTKSFRQLLAVLNVLGYEVDVEVKHRPQQSVGAYGKPRVVAHTRRPRATT